MSETFDILIWDADDFCTKVIQVDGEPVSTGTWIDGRKVFVHTSPFTGLWTVSDGATGRAITKCHKTKEDALAKLAAIARRMSPDMYDNRVRHFLANPTELNYAGEDCDEKKSD